jgi:hypothetical protein
MGVLEGGNYFKKYKHYSVIFIIVLGCDAHSAARLLGKPQSQGNLPPYNVPSPIT